MCKDAQTGNLGRQTVTSYRITLGVHTAQSLPISMDPLTSI